MSKLQITFLGTTASVPTSDRGLPAIAVKWQGNIYLFDCGEGTQRRMMQEKVGYGSVAGIFLSHLHLDHILGIYGLIETLHLLQPVPKKLSLFTPKGFELINNYPFITKNEIKPRGGLLLDAPDFSISAFLVKHTKNAYGFVFLEKDRRKFDEKKAHAHGLKGPLFREIQEKGSLLVNGKKIHLDDVSWIKPGRKIVYSGDCAPSESLIKAANGADLLIHEATFASDKEEEAKDRLHSTSLQAAETAKKAHVKQLILTHISPRYNEKEKLGVLVQEAKSIFSNTIIAFDGLVIEI